MNKQRGESYFGIVVFSLFACVILLSYARDQIQRRNAPDVDDISRMVDEMYKGPEALEWLKSNENPSALASNRFGPTKDAIDFVQTLYDTGAKKVLVSQSCIREDAETLEDEGGPYADGLVVVVPQDPEKREKLLTIFEEESTGEGFDFGPDQIYNDKMFLWWD